MVLDNDLYESKRCFQISYHITFPRREVWKIVEWTFDPFTPPTPPASKGVEAASTPANGVPKGDVGNVLAHFGGGTGGAWGPRPGAQGPDPRPEPSAQVHMDAKAWTPTMYLASPIHLGSMLFRRLMI